MVNGRLSCSADDWHTPEWLVTAGQEILGHIDLDPASNPQANQLIKAKQIYTKDNCGLEQDWSGNVFLNPPGGKTKNVSNAKLWWDKAVAEFETGRVDNLFWVGFSIEQLCLNPSMFNYLVCTLRHRIKFIKGDKENPSHANMVILMSHDFQTNLRFYAKFNSLGLVFSYREFSSYLNHKKIFK